MRLESAFFVRGSRIRRRYEKLCGRSSSIDMQSRAGDLGNGPKSKFESTTEKHEPLPRLRQDLASYFFGRLLRRWCLIKPVAPRAAFNALAAGVLAYYIDFYLTRSSLQAACLSGVVTSITLGLMIRHALKAKEEEFVRQLPDALDIMVRGLRAGSPIAEALHVVSAEMDGAVSSVFRNVCGNLALGMSLGNSLARVIEIMPVREFRFFVVGVTIQLDTGGNLVDLLAALSLLLRRRNQMHLKVRALSSEARASAWILGALPVVAGIAIWVLNPGYLATFLHDQRGRVIAFAGVMSLVAGAFTMARMTKLRS